MASKVCQICGENSGIYPLCKEHLEMIKTKEVIKNEKTGKWELIKNNTQTKDQKTKCLICGENTEMNFLFCKEHYKEYKDKSITIKITNCTDIEFLGIIDKYETGLINKCKDGHLVRSKSEVLIDNYLYDHDIKHAYEKPYPIDNNKNNDLHPDFYLPEYDLYIEHWGYSNKANYKEEKEYKCNIYKKNKTTIIGTTEEDILDVETNLKRKLDYYKKGEIN